MLEIRLVSSLEKVGIGQDPAALDGEVSMYAFRGETVSFQIAFREIGKVQPGPAGRKDCRARSIKIAAVPCREREGEEKADPGAQAPIVRIRRVLPVLCRRSCNPDSVDEDYLFYDARKAPDILRDMDPEECIPVTGEWQSLWVDVCPGKEQASGCYDITFALRQLEGEPACGASSGGEASQKETDSIGNPQNDVHVRIKIHVIGAELPKLSIPHTEWFHCDGIADYYGVEVFSEAFWRIFGNFLDVYVKRGGNTILTPVVTPPLDTEAGGERTTVQLVDVALEGGEYRLGFANLERFLDICLKHGVEYFEICHLFTQWGAEAAPKVVAEADGVKKRIFGWDTPSDDKEYLRFLGELIPALKELLERRGLLSRTFFHISDEPNLDSGHYRNAREAIRPLLEGCTVIEAVSDYGYYEKGLVDIPVCAVNHMEPFLEKRPPRLWSYFCCAQTVEVPNRFISMPSRRNRIYGTLLYWHRMDGFLHWGFNFYNSILSRKKIDPYESVDADEGFPAGDPFLVYPGTDGVPEESIRLMVQEEGINDYRALCLLESRIGRERVMGLIRQEAGMELTFRQYPRDDEFLLRLRERVCSLLEEPVRCEDGNDVTGRANAEK